ncbi:unnamed protein product, partial [marine sediment metagenome]
DGFNHYVVTIHDQKVYLEPGDWIIAEPDGVHFYPCKPDIFEATYDAVDGGPLVREDCRGVNVPGGYTSSASAMNAVLRKLDELSALLRQIQETPVYKPIGGQ